MTNKNKLIVCGFADKVLGPQTKTSVAAQKDSKMFIAKEGQMTPPKFVKWSSNDYGDMYISQQQNNGGFPFYYVIKLDMIEEWSEEMFKELDAKYSVTLEVVSPYAALWSQLCSAFQSSGYESDDMPEDPLKREYAVVELLSEFGTKARMDQKVGNNKSILLQNARKVAKEMNNFTFGFRMDSPQNACGDSGWDFLKGNIGWRKENEDLPFA